MDAECFRRVCGFVKQLRKDVPGLVEVYDIVFAKAVPFEVYRFCEGVSKEYTRVKGVPVYFFVRRAKVKK